MLQTPMEVLTEHPVRKSSKQKQAFREAVACYASSLGYEARQERGPLGCQNLILGDPEQADFLITAHYDTCAGLPFPNLLTPCNLWAFLGYQGLLAALLLAAAFAVGLAAGLLAGSGRLAGVVAYLFLLLEIWWMLAGPANPTNANDNTSGVVTVLEILSTLPEGQRGRVCFVLFDLEELGMVGSAAYRRAHREATDRQLVLNLDCVGDGDHIRMFPTKKLKKDRERLTTLYQACGYFGKKSILLHEKGFAVYPSDQGRFPWGVGICALRRSWAGLYVGRIHTRRDTVLEVTNINLLRAALTTLVTCGAGQQGNRKEELEHETL